MKKIHLIIESVLAVAIIVLFVLHFACGKSCSTGTTSTVGTTQPGAIAYVNIDSVLQNYKMFTDLKSELETKKNRLEADMGSKTKNYQSALLDYQNKTQKGLITRATAADLEQQLGAEQQKLMQLQQQYQGQLAEEEQVMHSQLLNAVMEFLKVYNKNKGFTYILGNSFGGNILYADTKNDVTGEVIKGLNAEYKPVKK
jgi:outer membrane protein